MKNRFCILAICSLMILFSSCSKKEDNTTVEGNQSPMGVVGTTVSSTSETIAGVSDFAAEVIALEDGVSTYMGYAIVNNPALKNLLSNFPEISISGDTVSTNNFRFKSTTQGIELMTGPTSGIWIKYSSEVGDTYPIGSTGNVRTVVSKSTTDDYDYGFFYIKVLKVEETTGYLKTSGVNKITYWGNHRFGLVGIEFSFDDETSAKFPVYTSAEN
jgi:hypothetical protein